MSVTGSRYIDREVENAISGVRQMKTLMEKASRDHQDILNALEDTKKKKEVCLSCVLEEEIVSPRASHPLAVIPYNSVLSHNLS